VAEIYHLEAGNFNPQPLIIRKDILYNSVSLSFSVGVYFSGGNRCHILVLTFGSLVASSNGCDEGSSKFFVIRFKYYHCFYKLLEYSVWETLFEGRIYPFLL